MSAAELKRVECLMAEPEPSDDLIDDVIGTVRRVGGVELAHEKALKMSLQAESELDGVPDGPARQALRDCLVHAVDRRS